MTRQQLRERLRVELLDDYQAPYLWSDETLNLLLNEAQDEVAIRARLFTRTSNITFAAGIAAVAMDADVIEVTRVKPAGKRLLDRTSIVELDRRSSSWDTRSGTPESYLGISRLMGGDGQLQIVPKPSQAITLSVTVDITLPALVADTDVCAVPLNRQWPSLHWAAYLAYSRRDADAEDRARAASHLAAFEDAFGYRHDANAERKRSQHRPHRVAMNRDWR